MEPCEARRLLAAHIVGQSAVFATIQQAVDVAGAGSIITVDAGTYPETVTINKQLTLLGAQAGVDGRSNARVAGVPESIVIGAADSSGVRSCDFYVTADDVTLDGFVVQNETSQDDMFGAGIVVAPGQSGVHIVNNIIRNNVSGIFLSNASPTDQAVIQHNLFLNNNNPGVNGGRGIYTNSVLSGGNITNVLIDGNAFRTGPEINGANRLEPAVGFESGVAGTQSNITVTNNSMDGVGKGVLFMNTTGVVIDSNVVTDAMDQNSGTLRFEGNNHDVTLTRNTVYDNAGPGVAVDASGTPGDSSDFVLNFNNFYNNSLAFGSKLSVVFDNRVFDGIPDVRNNWWGDPSGPGGDGPGAGDTVYGIGQKVFGSQWSVTPGGDELFSPWLTSPNGTLSTPYWGFAATDGPVIQAEDYDQGGELNAYHDLTATNSGGKYRTREGVDLERTTDIGGGYDIGWTRAGEWIDYTISIANDGPYQFNFRIANGAAVGGVFHVEIDGQDVSGAMTMPATGGWQKWQTITTPDANLTAGSLVLRIVMDTAGSGGSIGNFNWLQVLPDRNPPPPPPSPIPPSPGLPSPFVSGDVGTVGTPGGATFANGVFNLQGSGADIWGNQDAFQFTYQQLTGDGTIIARVASQQASDLLAKAGIDLRDSLAPSAKHAGLYVMPGIGVRFIRRHSTGGGSTSSVSTDNSKIKAPVWLKLVRSGSTITAYRSFDGLAWTLVGTDSIAMGQTIYVGLAVCSHQSSTLSTATFDNVSISPGNG